MEENQKTDKLSKSASIQKRTATSSFDQDRSRQEGCFDKYAGFFDLFSMEHSRRIDRGDVRSYGSFVGLFFTFLVTGMILLYTAQKLEILILKKDDRIILTELPFFYDDSETFTGSDNFNIAFGFVRDFDYEDLIEF